MRQLPRLLGIAGVLLHGSGEFFHGGGSFFQAAGLLLSAVGQVAIACRNLGGGQAHVFCRNANLQQHGGNLVRKLVESTGNLCQLVLAAGIDAACQIALAAGDVRQGIAHHGQAPQQAGHTGGQQDGGSHDAGQGNQHLKLQQLAQGGLGIGLVHGNAQHPGRAVHGGGIHQLRSAIELHLGMPPGLGQPGHE